MRATVLQYVLAMVLYCIQLLYTEHKQSYATIMTCGVGCRRNTVNGFIKGNEKSRLNAL